MEAILPGFITIWFDSRCVANILSQSKSKNRHHVMYYSAKGNQFIMIMPNKEVLFNESRNELYYHDMGDCNFVLVNMVEEN